MQDKNNKIVRFFRRFVATGIAGILLAADMMSASATTSTTISEAGIGNASVETPGILYLVTTGQVPVRTLPDETSPAFAIMQAGEIVISTAITGSGWYHITFCGINGYIKGGEIQPYAGGEVVTPAPVVDLSKKEDPFIMSALGDSITYGEKVSSQEKVYFSLLGTMLGAGKLNNYGLSGSAVAGNHPLRFVDRFRAMDPDADLIFVFGGTNDFGFHTPLGAMGDTTVDTFYGGLNLMMCEMMQRYPKSQIVFLTPLRRLRDTRKNRAGNVLAEYAQAIKEMGAFYDIPVIDLYSAPEVCFLTDRYRYMKDGIHPNDAAQSILADYLYQKLTIKTK